MTPEQFRALATEAESETCRVRYTAREAKSLALEQAAALRAAADQLEAVRTWAEKADSLAQGDSPYYPDLFNILESNNNGKH